jgi:carboxypeptidase family protein
VTGSRSGRAIARATFLIGAVLLGAAANAAANGTISGRVTSSTTTNGLQGTVLQFYQFEADDFVATTMTDAAGNYTSPSLAPGTYALLTQDIHGYINEICVATGINGCSPIDIKCSATCDTSSIVDGFHISTNAITNVDFSLTPGYRISGTITANGGGPIQNVTVYFIDGAGQMFFSQATTNAMGQYTMDGGTANGNVYVVTFNALGYFDEVYNNHVCIDCDVTAIGNPVVVSGADVAGIDFGLDHGAQITGTVTDTTPTPVLGVHVILVNGTGDFVADAFTDATGHYGTPGLLSGTYYAFTNNDQQLVDKLYNNRLCPRGRCNATQGDPITVTSPAVTSGINFSLPPGGTLTGTVTAASGGAPIDGLFVAIYDSGGLFLTGANTDDNGVYFQILPTGTYYAAVQGATGFANQLYNGIACAGFCNITSGTQIHVTAGATTANINFALTAGASITGTVLNGSNSNSPINGMPVQLFSSSGSFLSSVNTDASGVYTFSSVSPASYYVRTNTTGGATGQFINMLYNSGGNVVCVQCTVTNSGGSLVVVTAGGTTNNINFTLTVGGRIGGTILKSINNQPVPAGVNAAIFTSTGAGSGRFAADVNGVYLSSGLPAGTYYVRTQNTINFIDKLYNNKPCTQSCNATGGDPVTVTLNNTTGGIDFSLDLGGSFSGKVTDAVTTAGIASASVTLYNSGGTQLSSLNTDFAGNYTTSGLPVGTYYARVQVNNTSYVGQAYNQKPCVLGSCSGTMTSTDPITVTLGATTPNINFPLTVGGRISGTVTDVATGLGIPGSGGNVQPKVYTSGGALLGFTAPDSSGNYLTGGLPPGTYYGRADALGYNTRQYNNKPCFQPCTDMTTGTPISVVANATTSGISYALTPNFTYTDGSLPAGTVRVKAVHVTELRTAINLMRQQLAIAPFSFTDVSLAGVVAKAVHITQLRTALDAVYDALGLTRPTYGTDPTLTPGIVIKGNHIFQIRQAIDVVK